MGKSLSISQILKLNTVGANQEVRLLIPLSYSERALSSSKMLENAKNGIF